MRQTISAWGSACLLGSLLLSTGCHRHRKSRSVANTDDYAADLQPLVASKQLPILHWPNFSDYQPLVETFYNDRNYELAWTRDGKPTATATQFMRAFDEADRKGLHPVDYDGPMWPARTSKLNSKTPAAYAEFDVAMTVCVMRYISDLRVGRVNPTHFNFDIATQEKKYDLPEFVSDQAVDAADVPSLLAGIEPNSEQYRMTQAAVSRYAELAREQTASPLLSQPLPSVLRPVSIRGAYPATEALAARLQMEGDLPVPSNALAAPSASPSTSDYQDQPAAGMYGARLVAGVRSFQHRHGLTEDGKLSAETIASLNVPLSDRVVQLENSLERWRWLPDQYVNAPLMVNLPEFVLRGYTPDHHVDFTMKVVVGKVVGEHQTPVFAHMMRYLIFRPYWNVPTTIAKKELVPHMQGDSGYLESKNFEATDGRGNVVTSYTTGQVAEGGVIVRERPGPKNSLGLVKFIFPNEYDVYLHSTPATELFNRTRRDFSHGCVRVQEPEKLAAWVLRNQPEWTEATIHDAMETGEDNRQVNLKTPIPIVIFYVTAIASEDGHIHFFDDIYHYDSQLRGVLAKGPPYPTAVERVDPNQHPVAAP